METFRAAELGSCNEAVAVHPYDFCLIFFGSSVSCLEIKQEYVSQS